MHRQTRSPRWRAAATDATRPEAASSLHAEPNVSPRCTTILQHVSSHNSSASKPAERGKSEITRKDAHVHVLPLVAVSDYFSLYAFSSRKNMSTNCSESRPYPPTFKHSVPFKVSSHQQSAGHTSSHGARTQLHWCDIQPVPRLLWSRASL